MQGNGKLVPDFVGDRLPVPDGDSQITAQGIPQPVEVLDMNGTVQAQFLAQLLQVLLGNRSRPFLAGEDEQRSITGDQEEEGKHNYGSQKYGGNEEA